MLGLVRKVYLYVQLFPLSTAKTSEEDIPD